MTEKEESKDKAKDTTLGGLKVTPPSRGQFFRSLEKVSRPEPEDREPDKTTDGP